MSERCFVRDGFVIERPTRVCNTFYAVSGVMQRLLRYAAALESGAK